MSDITSHLSARNSRYYTNTKKPSFNTTLKGLTVIEMCITEICTRACVFCPRGNPEVYKNQKLFMSLNTLQRIAQECKVNSFNGDFHFSGFGESLTHKEFFTIIAELKNILPNNHIALTTNGDLLTEDKAVKVYQSGVDHIIVSCYDGEESYIKFDKMLSNLNKSYDIRKLWFHEGETVEEMTARNQFNNRSGAVTKINFEESKKTFMNTPCYLPFYKLVFDYNGDVLLCCNDWFRKHKGFGNIHRSTLQDIWYSDEFKKIRDSLKRGNRNGPACTNCSIKGNLVGKESVQAHEEKL
jgi:radical SAM protein with 4Fe4S-binding SPASM domain